MCDQKGNALNKVVYRWRKDLRYGILWSMFVAPPEKVKESLGRTARFGEALGKYSDIYFDLAEKQFEIVSEDPKIVEFVEKYPTGYNPIKYSHWCDYCGDVPDTIYDPMFSCEECGELCKDCYENNHDCKE